MLETFRQWFEARQELFSHQGINLHLSPTTQGPSRNKIVAELRTARQEWTLELWETGEADFHFLDWEHMENEVVVTHFEFRSTAELRAELDRVLASFTRGDEVKPT
jgi:hypothetical protein